MSQQSSENKKLDFSSLPRGAIGIRGLPVSRNTRLPSIRSPRDLTLGAPPKRTFMPNIPVRREKKSQPSSSVSHVKQEITKNEIKSNSFTSDRGRGRGRGKEIIQTQGAIFSEGIAADAARKEKRARESYMKSANSAPARGITIKKEVEDKDIARVSSKLDNLFRDDFIDDGDDDYECATLKPIIFPPVAAVKKEVKCDKKEPVVNFDPDIAKEMGFDVNQVAKFIKKEKGTETVETEEVKADESPHVPSNEMNNLLNLDSDSSKLILLKLPQFLNVAHKMDEAESSQRRTTTIDKTVENQKISLSSVKCLPEGHIGKLQIMKSGKTRLLVGPVEYTLDSFSSIRNSKHEIVSITTNSSTGDLCVLGCVNDVLNFAPNDSQLLGQS